MHIKQKQDFWSGVMFIVIGLAFSWGATSYSLGTAARMGPGYFPFWLGIVMAVLGAVVLVGALGKKAEEVELEKFDYKIAAIVVGSTALAGVALDFLGVYITIFLYVVASSYAAHDFNWKVAVANGVFLVLFVWLAFIKGLGLIFPLWPSFLGN
jgi:hypothetical protein